MMRTYSPAFLIVALLAVCASATARQGNGKTSSAPQLYARHCASCHGADGRSRTSKGKFSHARDLTDAKWQDDVTDERIFNSIMNGRNVRGNMPAFSDKLDERDVDEMVRYVRKFKG
jgi:mono/diheme cytochrome c family protein